MPVPSWNLLRQGYMPQDLLEASDQQLSNTSWRSLLPSSHSSADGKS